MRPLLHIAALAAPQNLGCYRTNNGQTSILAGDGYDVNDPLCEKRNRMMLQCDTRALGCSVDRVSAEIIIPTFPQPLIVIATIAVLTSKKMLPTTRQARSIVLRSIRVPLSTRRRRLLLAF